ncbi:MAG: hypothetical protein KKH06_03645, partial [Gammaproteobacteria bacterium]|nr:hypothetical protein [Gammaproteobacteria bacterium]
VIVALWLKRSSYNQTFKYLSVIVAIFFLLPNFNPDPTHVKYPSHLQWTTKFKVPDFFSKNIYKRYLKKNAIVVALPYYEDAACEPGVWQVQSKMHFRLASACLGGSPREFMQMPIYNSLPCKPASDVDSLAFQQYLNAIHPSAIIVKESLFQEWQPLFTKLHLKAKHISGIAFIALDHR